MVSTQKKKNQHKRPLNQLNENSKDFLIGSNVNVCAVGDEVLDTQITSCPTKFERFAVGEIIVGQNEVTENNIDDRNSKAIDIAVKTVANPMHDTILTAMDNIIFARVEMALGSITGPSDQRPSSVV